MTETRTTPRTETVYHANVCDGRGVGYIWRNEETRRGRVVSSEYVGMVVGVHTEREAITAARQEGMIA